METVVNTDFGTVNVYPDKKIVHHQFKKFVFGEHFQKILGGGANAFSKYNCNKYLSDDRNGGVIRPEDAQWGFENWGQKIIASGWKFWAVVLPEKTVGQMSMKKVTEYFTQKGVTIKTFTDPTSAMIWLEQQH